jgi:hypothetical protein
MDGTLCDDGKICTTMDVCKSGVCVGTTIADGTHCTNGDVCEIHDSAVCMSGKCLGTPAPDGYPCLDDDPCTDPDTCHSGKCIPGPPKVCSDGNICTIDSCVTGKGCLFSPIPECTGDAADGPVDADGGDASDAADAVINPIDTMSMDMLAADKPAMDETGADLSLPETGDVGDGPSVEVAGDAAVDLPGDGVSDQVVDAPEIKDAALDQPLDGGGDASDDQGETPPDLRARGGACVCSAGDGAAGPGWWLFGPMLALGCRRRRAVR